MASGQQPAGKEATVPQPEKKLDSANCLTGVKHCGRAGPEPSAQPCQPLPAQTVDDNKCVGSELWWFAPQQDTIARQLAQLAPRPGL